MSALQVWDISTMTIKSSKCSITLSQQWHLGFHFKFNVKKRWHASSTSSCNWHVTAVKGKKGLTPSSHQPWQMKKLIFKWTTNLVKLGAAAALPSMATLQSATSSHAYQFSTLASLGDCHPVLCLILAINFMKFYHGTPLIEMSPKRAQLQ